MSRLFLTQAMTTEGDKLTMWSSRFPQAKQAINHWKEKGYEVEKAWVDIFKDDRLVSTISLLPYTELDNSYNGKPLYDIVRYFVPSAIKSDCMGGVIGCPCDYSLFGSGYSCNRSDHPGNCSECWRQPYAGTRTE